MKSTILLIAKRAVIINKINVIMLFRDGLAEIQFFVKLPINAIITTNHGVNIYNKYLGHMMLSTIK